MTADLQLDPAALSPLERRAEIATLLATAFLRRDEVRLASQIAADLALPPPDLSRRPQVSLEVSRDPSVHVAHRRFETGREKERSR